MMHEFVDALFSQHKSSGGKFKRYECVCILDLAHLTPSKVGKRQLNIIKVQSTIDSLCFPETLNKMIIVNTPGFFSMTWKLIRGWIDQRTSSKVEVVGSDKDRLLKKLSTIIDPDELPSDYGGNGESVDEFLKKDMLFIAESKREVGSRLKLEDEDPCLVSFKGFTSRSITVQEKKAVKLSFLTRSLTGCQVVVKNMDINKVLSVMNIVHKGADDDDENEIPTRYNLEDYGLILYGVQRYEIEFKSHAARYKHINVMMAIKKFTTVDAKTLCSQKHEGKKKSVPQATSISTQKNVSICTGTFSPIDNQYVLVEASPHTERRLAILERRRQQGQKVTNHHKQQYETDCDEHFGGIPRIKRIASNMPGKSSQQALKRDESKVNHQLVVLPESPQRTHPKMCGMFNQCG
jgi:hypothetical protein